MTLLASLRSALLAGIAAVAAFGAAQAPRAFRPTPIRVGVIVLRSAQTGGVPNPSAAPFAFYNLENARTIKPAEWVFTNPLAPTLVTQEVYNRWSALDPSIVGRVTPNVTRMQKRYAAYWEVDLAALSDEDVAQYDVLLLAPIAAGVGPNEVQLGSATKERLRRFVDGGGTLWLDLTEAPAATTDPTGIAPFAITKIGTGAGSQLSDLAHPLLRTPNALSPSDMRFLNAGGGGFTLAGPAITGNSASLLSSLLASFTSVGPVALENGGMTIGVANIGEGSVVTTVRAVAEKLGSNVGDASFATNRRFLAGETRLTSQGSRAAKFAVNLVSLNLADKRQFGGGPRKTSSTFLDLGAPLLQTYRASYGSGFAPGAQPTYTANPKAMRPPVFYNGLVFVSTDDRILVYDADPRRDLDLDGNPDDGLPDLNFGSDQDLVFATAPVAGGISTATVARVPDATTAPKDQLLVTDAQGRLFAYQIYGNPTGALANVSPVATLPPPTGGVAGGGEAATIHPPTVVGSMAFVTSTVPGALGTNGGIVSVYDLRTLAPVTGAAGVRFVAGGPTNNPPPSGPATIGLIPIADNSGGSDLVVYQPVLGQTGAASNGPGFISYWFGTKGEKPYAVEVQAAGPGANLVVTTRAATQNGLPVYLPNPTNAASPIGIKLTLVRTDGSVYSPTELNAVFNGIVSQNNGVLTFGMVGGALPADVDPENPVRIDYTIDWGAAANSPNLERGRLFFPDPSGNRRRVIGGLAMSPQGTLYAAVGTQDVGGASPTYLGSLFAVREEGRGSFRVSWRWDLYPKHTLAWNGGSRQEGPTLPDNDPVQFLNFGGFSLSNVLGGPFSRATFQGPPVVRGNQVFVTVSGVKAAPFANVPSSAILAFDADPPTPRFRTDQDLSTAPYSIVQPDFARSGDPTNPQVFSQLTGNLPGGGGALSFERAATGVGGNVIFNSLGSVRNGQLVDSISLSQPIFLRRPGQADVLLDAAGQDSSWSPLKWYTILHGTQLYGPAFGAGNTLYMSGSSSFPSFLQGQFPPVNEGFVQAMRTDIDLSVATPVGSAFTTNTTNFAAMTVIADDARPWMRQVISLDYPRATNAFNSSQADLTQLYSNPAFVWPQNPRNVENRGVVNFEDIKTRVFQSILPGSQGLPYPSLGVAGGGDILSVWNSLGTYAFRRTEFWIADEGRIAKVDASGNVLYDSRASSFAGEKGSSDAANVSPLIRPTRVVPIQRSDDVLVVDTPTNRLLRMTPQGTVTRQLTSFELDPTLRVPDFKAGAPLDLAQPRDVATWSTFVLAANNSLSNPQPKEEQVHYLIADAGNRRLVEVVDRIQVDPATDSRQGYLTKLPVLVWTSPATASGKGFDYNSVQRLFYVPDPTQPTQTKTMYVAGVGLARPGRVDAGETPPTDPTPGAGSPDPADGRDALSGGGGVVVFDPALPAGLVVYGAFQMPQVARDRLLVQANPDGSVRVPTDPSRPLDAIVDPATAASMRFRWDADPGVIPGGTRRFRGVRSVTASCVSQVDANGNVIRDGNGNPTPQIAVMVTDNSGVYEMIPVAAGTPTDPNRTVLQVRWMMPNDVYRSIYRDGAPNNTFTLNAASPFNVRPVYARRLDDENVILVSDFRGTERDLTPDPLKPSMPQTFSRKRFEGEVLQLDGRIGYPAVSGTIGGGYNVQSLNLGFDLRSIRVRFGPVEGARGILAPVFADRR